jgi:NADH dehydrogenase [ubiquinone] 1 alpha subcomplex assembly factor 1
MSDERMLMFYDFATEAQFKSWMVINDGVMGGVSRSTFTKAEPDGAVFTGEVSLENYGGFCSVSSRQSAPVDASAFSGIALRCRGDGKTYKLTLKNDASFGGFSYQFRFAVMADEWMVVKAPFGEFKASFRGQAVPDAPPFNPGVIQSVGLLIADKQAGAFKLEIAWIQAYAE